MEDRRLTVERIFKIGEKTHTVLLTGGVRPCKATVDGKEIEYDVDRVGENELVFATLGKQTRLFIAQGKGGEAYVNCEGRTFKLSPIDRDFGANGGESGGVSSGRLIASMPGRILQVLSQPGQEVQENQPVIIMESMKMEITLTALFNGKVEEVNVKVGQQVDAGALLVKIEPISK